MKKTAKIFTFTLLWLFALTAFAQKVQVEQKVGVTQMYIGDQTEYTLSVTAKPDAKVQFPDYQLGGEQVQYISKGAYGLEVLEHVGGDTVTLDDGYVRMTRRYSITAFDPHIYTIDSVPVVVDGKPYFGEKLALKVLDVDVDTTDTTKMCPPKGIQDNEFSWAEWLPLIFAFILAVALALLAAWLYMQKKKGRTIRLRFRTVKHVPPHEKAMAEIDEIKQHRLPVSDNQKEYYTRLTDALRRYMEERFGFSAMEMTTSEIIERLQQEDKEKVNELRLLFETADLVKFAKHSALVNENDRNLMAAVDFINSTKTEETTTVENKQEELTEQEEKQRRTQTLLIIFIYVAGIAAAALTIYAVWRFIDLIG